MKKINKDICAADPEQAISNTETEITDKNETKKKETRKRRKITKDKPEKVKVPLIRRLNRISFNSLIRFVAAIGTMIAILLILHSVFAPKTHNTQILGFAWERSSVVETGYISAQSDWYLPSNGILQYTNEEVQSYNQVFDHYETKTETYYEQEIVGYEEQVIDNVTTTVPVYQEVEKTREIQVEIFRDEPVYATKYYYNIELWKEESVQTSNGDDKNPYWPSIDLDSNQRIGKQTEHFYIYVEISNEITKVEVPYDVWNNLSDGDKVKVESNFFGDRIYQGVQND